MSEILIKDIEQKMINSINHLVDEFSTIRTGRANPSLVDKLNVEYYGTKTPLQQLATISVPDPKLLVIQPFDKTALEEIENSVVFTLTSTGIVITSSLLGWMIFGEHINKRNWVGILICTLSIYLFY